LNFIIFTGGMLAETPFYYRLSQLKSRVGESVVQSPGYTACCAGQRAAAVDLLHLRLAKVELTVSPQKSARRCVTRVLYRSLYIENHDKNQLFYLNADPDPESQQTYLLTRVKRTALSVMEKSGSH
jgi:hypothetical protein